MIPKISQWFTVLGAGIESVHFWHDIILKLVLNSKSNSNRGKNKLNDFYVNRVVFAGRNKMLSFVPPKHQNSQCLGWKVFFVGLCRSRGMLFSHFRSIKIRFPKLLHFIVRNLWTEYLEKTIFRNGKKR